MSNNEEYPPRVVYLEIKRKVTKSTLLQHYGNSLLSEL